MSDGFWTAFFGALTVLVPFAWTQYRLLKKEREELREQSRKLQEAHSKSTRDLSDAIANATQVIRREVKLKDDEIDLLKTGAFRMGHEAGKKQAADELRRFQGPPGG